jgi:hypothetical protein
LDVATILAMAVVAIALCAVMEQDVAAPPQTRGPSSGPLSAAIVAWKRQYPRSCQHLAHVQSQKHRRAKAS